MRRILYLDCFSGISGDMTVGALLDAGGSFDALKSELLKLGIEEEYELAKENVNKNGITSTKFHVKLLEAHVEHHHHHDHHHHEEQPDNGLPHQESHHHRTYKHIKQMINESKLDIKVKERALAMFHVIAVAEAKIHGTDLDHVHFHEVGAVDSIIDIVGTAILIEQLEIDEIIASPVPLGSGHIHIDHGIYPVPAPATLEILRDIPIKKTTISGELTTPTGAAILKALVQQYSTLPTMEVKKIGYGAGTKTFPQHPNVLRVVIGGTVS